MPSRLTFNEQPIWMVALRRLAYVTLVLLGLVTPAAGQSRPSIPLVAVSVVRVPRAPQADSASSLTVVVRSAEMLQVPEQPLQEAWIAFGAPRTDVRAHPEWTLMTDGEGKASTTHLVHDSLDVVVLRIGYGAVRFSIELAKQCRQTVEVYVVSDGTYDVEASAPPRPRPRVVLTTCAPQLRY